MTRTELDQTLDSSELPPINDIDFGALESISLSANTTSLTHGLHRYPAKYIPQIPRWAIQNFSHVGETVLDPFCGSGTTVLEAIAAGRNSIGVDLDPLACFIARSKITPPSHVRLRELAHSFTERELSVFEGLRPLPLQGIDNPDHWFTPKARADLHAIHEMIHKLSANENEIRFLSTIFSSIIRLVSNADDQSQKTYVSGTLPKNPPPVLPAFVNRLNRAIKGVREFEAISAKGSGEILCRSAEDMKLEPNSVELIVTSPPYLDSVDYVYNFMLEYFWLGPSFGIQSRRDLNTRKRRYTGAKNPAEAEGIPSVLGNEFKLADFPAYRRKAIGPYFELMRRHFVEAARTLKENGRYVLVVGNSRTQNGVLPLHDAMVALASEAGLKLEHAFGYRIRRHYMKFPRQGRGGIILTDWVITLKKTNEDAAYAGRLPLLDEQHPPDAVAN